LGWLGGACPQCPPWLRSAVSRHYGNSVLRFIILAYFFLVFTLSFVLPLYVYVSSLYSVLYPNFIVALLLKNSLTGSSYPSRPKVFGKEKTVRRACVNFIRMFTTAYIRRMSIVIDIRHPPYHHKSNF